MEARLNGHTFGQFPLPMALCWQRVDESTKQPTLHRLHLVLTEAPKYHPRQNCHPAYPGGKAIGLLWGCALDGEERPVWEVRPDQNGWQLQHVHGGGHHPLISQSGSQAHRFWPLHRVHAYDAFGLRPVLHNPIHFEVPQHQSQGPLESSPSSLLHWHRDVRDQLPAASNESPSAEFTDPEDETEANTVSDSSASQTDTGVHWDFGSRLSVRRNQRKSHLKRIKEEDGAREVETGFPSSDDAAESTIARYNATVAGLAQLCHCMHTPGSSLPRFDFSQLAQLPFEWPMARLSIDFPSIAASFSQNVSRLAVEKTLNGQTLTDSWLYTTCEKLAWEATGQAASVIATLFQGTGSVEVLHQFPAWLHLESQEFWQKALYIELAGECHDLAPMSRSSQSPNVKKRCADSISSFVVIQRQKQNANRLPMQNVKVYFPCLLITQVLRNLPSLSVEGAVTVDQSLRSAISQDVVSMGSAIYDTTQQFSTLVLRAGRTSLPSLHVPDLSTPLTRKVFTAGLFDATTTSNLGASFGQTKVRLEVRSASPEQYEGDFNTEKEWHQYMPTPWDVMQLSPAQALTISCKSCGVQIASGDLRDTYGRSFVVKSLDKIKRDCCNLFPQDNKRINLPRLASIFEEPGFVTPDAPQHQFGAHREHCSVSGLSNWMSVVLIPLTLPCRYLSHGRQCPTLHIPPSENAVEEPARAKREANKKASSNALQGLDQAPAKAVTGSLQKHF